jgi:hypothetical protein
MSGGGNQAVDAYWTGTTVPGDAQFCYETVRSFSAIAYGGGDFGEILAISEQISERDYDSSHDAYLAAADPIAAEGG